MATRAISARRRDHLAQVAAHLVHRKGFANTSLADIAAAAKVALGSIYFYYQSKGALAQAVVERRVRLLEARFAAWQSLPSPRTRLEALVDVWLDDRVSDSRYGCPVGSLCYELAKQPGALGTLAARPFRTLLAWCVAQFEEMGHRRDARTLALHLLCSLQGMGLIANSLRDPDVIATEALTIKRWLRLPGISGGEPESRGADASLNRGKET